MPGLRGRGPLLAGISTSTSSIGGNRKLQAAQSEWSRRLAPATMPPMTAEAMATRPQMTMTVGMWFLGVVRLVCQARPRIKAATVAVSSANTQDLIIHRLSLPMLLGAGTG